MNEALAAALKSDEATDADAAKGNLEVLTNASRASELEKAREGRERASVKMSSQAEEFFDRPEIKNAKWSAADSQTSSPAHLSD